MTRKKFVKQLMALGYQRNTAELVAVCVRVAGETHAQHMEEKKRYYAANALFKKIKISLVDNLTPVLQAAAQAVENLAKVITEAMEKSQFEKSLLDWTRENVPQSNEQHPADGLDAMVYTLDQLQIVEQEPAQEWPAKNPYLAHHGYVCGIDLANGPDFTAGGGGNE